MKGNRFWVVLLPLILALAGWGAVHFPASPLPTEVASTPINPSISYETVLGKVETERKDWLKKWKAATAEKRGSVENQAGQALTRLVVEDIFPHWVGTGWDFNGTSTVPGQGKIACGYFVTTLLEDASVVLPRVKLAQQASSVIMTSLAGGEKPKWYSNLSASAFAAKMVTQPEGLYVLGLDYHTGFLWISEGKAYFLHSNYLPPQKVVKERVESSAAIEASSVKVVGKVSNSHYLIRRWLDQTAITLAQ